MDQTSGSAEGESGLGAASGEEVTDSNPFESMDQPSGSAEGESGLGAAHLEKKLQIQIHSHQWINHLIQQKGGSGLEDFDDPFASAEESSTVQPSTEQVL